MIIKTYNESHDYLLFIDIEFNNRKLVQFSGLLFQWIDDEVYQLIRSCNQYITTQICYPFIEYTNISQDFLTNNGITLFDALELINNDFLKDIDLSKVEVISHGLKNDRMILKENGLDLISFNDLPIDGYCTFLNAKRILNRDNLLTANDIANECGYYSINPHNAYSDVWTEVAIFTYLKKMEQQQKENNKNE